MESVETSNSARTPSSEFAIDEALLYSLLSEQHSDLAHLPISYLDAGWDNMMWWSRSDSDFVSLQVGR